MGEPKHPLTKRPLDPDEVTRLLQSIPNFVPEHEGWYKRIPRQTVEFVLYTGVHPIVFAEPDKFQFRVAKANVGKRGLMEGVAWTRPKNARAMWVPCWKEVPWLTQYVRDHKPFSERMLEYMVGEIGEGCGLPGLSPRTLRHTFIGWLYWGQHLSPPQVEQYSGCTRDVAMDYATKFQHSGIEELVA